jgi:fimbrial chaperone protein
MTVRLFSATFVIGTLLASSVASASGLQVAPTSLDLAPNKNADGLWLSNTGDGTLHAQVRVFHWTQEGSEERLAPSRGLAISPPMLQIDSGARQLVRVIRSAAPPNVNEDAFRVLIDELPVDESQASQDGSKSAVPEGGLQYVLRYSIPIFVQPTGNGGSVTPKLSGKIVHEGDQTFIEVTNQGTGHAQLGNLVLVGAEGKREELSAGLVGYVLPGQTKRWPLKVSAQALASATSLQSRINSEPVEQTLVLLAPAR